MQNVNQIYLYMKEEIERQAKADEKKILDEIQTIEEELERSVRAKAKRDALQKIRQNEDEMHSNAAIQISENHIERTKALIQKRNEYVDSLFEEAKSELLAFTNTKEYLSFVENKLNKVKTDFDMNSIVYIKEGDGQLKDIILKLMGSVEIKVSKHIKIGGIIIEGKENHLSADETLDYALQLQKEWFSKHSNLTITGGK